MIQRDRRTTTIAVGASLSPAVDIQGYDLVSIDHPAAAEGVLFSFQTSFDGVTYSNVFKGDGTELQYTTAASRTVAIPYTDLHYFGRFVKIRTGLSGAATNQVGATATFALNLRTLA